MTLEMDAITAAERVAKITADLKAKVASIDAVQGDAVKSAGLASELRMLNDELQAAARDKDVLDGRVGALRAEREAVKAARGQSSRTIIPDNDDTSDVGLPARRADGSWGDAVLAANQQMAGHRGVKSFMSVGSATVATSVGGPVEDPRRARFLRELMPSEDAPGGHVAYLRQTVRTNLAAVVAAGGVKPTSVYTLTRVDDTTDTIAHLSEPINRVDLDDAPIVRQFVEAELRLGLELAIDAAIIAAVVAAGPLVEGDIGTTLDTTRRCVTRLQEREVEPTAWLLHPRDWEQIELEAAAAYIANANFPAPTDSVRRSLYGYPVFLSNAVTENTGYLGDFAGSAKLYRTGGVAIDWSEGHYDSGTGATDFERNLVRFRAETRVLPAILRSFAFVQINLAATGS